MSLSRVGMEMWRDYHNRMDPEAFRQSITDHLKYTVGRDQFSIAPPDLFTAVACSVRDRLIDRAMATEAHYRHHGVKRAYYLSVEYLIGRSLDGNLVNLDYRDVAAEALRELGLSYEEIAELEADAGLGNGGLGRLAACFIESLATLGYPAVGYGLRYDFGFFRQDIRDGRQIEVPDTWLKYGNPWEFARPHRSYPVQFYGRVDEKIDETGRFTATWRDTQTVIGVPYDMLIAGYGTNTVNLLRLWSARGTENFDLQIFNTGDFNAAVHQKVDAETITKVLYPADDNPHGKELRLRQQYFFVSCSLQDILRRFLDEVGRDTDRWDELPARVAIQLNDTHPSLAVPELMRLLLDQHHFGWERAWDLVTRVFSYTNHTLMPEALERWPLELMRRMLPRHTQLIFEINRRFLEGLREQYPDDAGKARRLSIIEEGSQPQVRMAHLAVVGSHTVNGVSALHSGLLQTYVMKEFHEAYPGKFVNVTNGVCPRRWVRVANPKLAGLVTETLGSDQWLRDLPKLAALDAHVDDASVRDRLMAIKHENKQALAGWIEKNVGVTVDPSAIFDVQIKRIHEYKRQLLNILAVIYRYQELLQNPSADWTPRVWLFAGKAAPGYARAKQIIALINAVAAKVNNDPRIGDKMKVLFLPNYGVRLAEAMIPAADVSEQISTAGYEASGTGNMKFALNGALTIGTMDGANVEMSEHIGEEHMYIFGLRTDEVQQQRPSYDPLSLYHDDEGIKHVLDAITAGVFSPSDEARFRPLIDGLLGGGDPYMLLADFRSYLAAQDRITADYRDTEKWSRAALHNIARMGYFSSDRSIQDYATGIWKIQPQQVSMPGEGLGATQILRPPKD